MGERQEKEEGKQVGHTSANGAKKSQRRKCSENDGFKSTLECTRLVNKPTYLEQRLGDANAMGDFVDPYRVDGSVSRSPTPHVPEVGSPNPVSCTYFSEDFFIKVEN